MDRFRLRLPCRADTNILIQSSKVPSKHFLTSASSIPSRGENVFIICKTKHSSFALLCS